MLELIDVSKRFNRTNFMLDKISVYLGKGLHVLAGPNGAGKSTLLRIIAGVQRPDSGSLSFGGQDIYIDLFRYKIRQGYLPQTISFYDNMTGKEFLCYLAGLKGVVPRAGGQRAEYVADLLGISSQCSVKITNWSTGLKQRLGLAQTLLNDPDILVLDEPFCGLDQEEQDHIAALLFRLSRDKVILLSSHIFAGLPMSKLLLLVDGKLQFAGLPTVFKDEARGQVWVFETEKREWLSLQNSYQVSAATCIGDRCQCRVICKNKPPIPGVKEVVPTMEDAYCWWMQRYRRKDEDSSPW
ncbi:ATP-binding cassette domain-containing protein [Sporomusa malonica]|uniref:ABC-type multidrug transport system, ATPase component n=1 Tax=Sporomusa malonica TaxID=112901 RepID=A0A1W2F1I0_9FIRM|nr:ATP-binding cassette domain-containing protein [Sporomusa malonica]SMD15827.1 ABC-type multidrug transport system, ATPase component [Sporomusa malonica]